MDAPDTLDALRVDADAIDTLGELYAGDGDTYADRLGRVASWYEAWELLADAASIATMSGDYAARDNIRGIVARYYRGLAEGREAARLVAGYNARTARIAAHATR